MIYSRFASTETGSAVASCLANAWRIVDRFTSFTHVHSRMANIGIHSFFKQSERRSVYHIQLRFKN
jgi:hypothetical protein